MFLHAKARGKRVLFCHAGKLVWSTCLDQGVDIAVSNPVLQACKACAVVEAEVELSSPPQAGLPLHMNPL